MTKEQLQNLWSETDKNISESYLKLRKSYESNNITKKEYDIEKTFIDGFYSGWRNLYDKVLSESN